MKKIITSLNDYLTDLTVNFKFIEIMVKLGEKKLKEKRYSFKSFSGKNLLLLVEFLVEKTYIHT
jgi:hypothetical protein